MKNLLKNAYYIIIPLLIVGINWGYTTFIISLLALIPLLFVTNRHTVGIFFLMFGGPLVGIVRTVYPSLPIYGLMFDGIGLLLIWDLVRDLFNKHFSSVLGVLLTLSFFGFCFLLGPRDDYALNKYSSMCMHGIAMLFGYFAINKSSIIDAEGLSRLLFLSAICLFVFTIKTYSFKVGGLFDYNWFREENAAYDRLNNFDVKLGGYQQIGMLALYAVTIIFSQVDFKLPSTLFYALCGFQLILMSGARQAILGLAIILTIRFVVINTVSKQNKNTISRFMGIIVGLIISYFVIMAVFLNVGSDAITQTISEGDTGRALLFFDAISIFKDYPIAGAGIGGFHAITGHVWPHNFVLELLCETGILGIIASFLLLIIPLIKKKTGLMHITNSNQFFFLIILSVVMRIMVSSDLRESIELFSAVYAVTSVKSF